MANLLKSTFNYRSRGVQFGFILSVVFSSLIGRIFFTDANYIYEYLNEVFGLPVSVDDIFYLFIPVLFLFWITVYNIFISKSLRTVSHRLAKSESIASLLEQVREIDEDSVVKFLSLSGNASYSAFFSSEHTKFNEIEYVQRELLSKYINISEKNISSTPLNEKWNRWYIVHPVEDNGEVIGFIMIYSKNKIEKDRYMYLISNFEKNELVKESFRSVHNMESSVR